MVPSGTSTPHKYSTKTVSTVGDFARALPLSLVPSGTSSLQKYPIKVVPTIGDLEPALPLSLVPSDYSSPEIYPIKTLLTVGDSAPAPSVIGTMWHQLSPKIPYRDGAHRRGLAPAIPLSLIPSSISSPSKYPIKTMPAIGDLAPALPRPLAPSGISSPQKHPIKTVPTIAVLHRLPLCHWN